MIKKTDSETLKNGTFERRPNTVSLKYKEIDLTVNTNPEGCITREQLATMYMLLTRMSTTDLSIAFPKAECPENWLLLNSYNKLHIQKQKSACKVIYLKNIP